MNIGISTKSLIVMKEIKKEIQKVEYITQYEAIDGTMFNDAEECKRYENSVEAVLLSRYNPLVVARKSEETLFNVGSCEYEIDIVKPTEEEIDTILQLLVLFNSHYDSKRLQEYRTLLNKVLEEDDFVLIGRGCNYDHYDSFYIINSLTDFVSKIVKQCDPETRVILEDE